MLTPIQQARGSANRYTMGFWLNYRKLETDAYGPGPRSRAALAGKMMKYYVLYSGLLGPNQTDRGRVIAASDYHMVALMGASFTITNAVPGAFAIQRYDTARRLRFSDQMVLVQNGFGTAQEPFWLRKPYHYRRGTQIQTKVTDLSGLNNLIAVVAFGYED